MRALAVKSAGGAKAVANFIQTKLQVGQPADRLEQEADAVAESLVSSAAPAVQMKCEECEEEESLQMKPLLPAEHFLNGKSEGTSWISQQGNGLNNLAPARKAAGNEREERYPARIGDGHDLQSTEFAGNNILESVFDQERYLTNGASGDAVTLLQNALIEQGHSLPEFGADGAFGFETKGAVISFQAEHQLAVDGVVGPETIGHLDTLNQGAAPPAAVADCCSDAKTAGLDGGDLGGVICCDNVKHACLWASGGSTGVTDPTASSIVDHCIRVHEYAHFDDVDCPTGAGPHRPPFKAGKVPATEEKKSYAVEKNCLEKMIGKCGDNKKCKKQVKKELAHVTANT